MKASLRLLALALAAALAGCSTPHRAPEPPAHPGPPAQTPPPVHTPQPRVPLPPAQPAPQQPTTMKAHPRYAPPPGGNCHWDNSLGVYVLENARDLYYRERTYYRWDGGWYWSNSPQGPWQETDSSGVPPGLGRRYAR
ncbi:hypothetical protein [Zestomonas thermotolerans]|uniref:hypothetical protein n=1 Tax=Zestomonas thermotolerans TaxID=157784 RepID=UPI000376DC92|nr:hypothetical protein [Pseudomonas thermotolerans]